MISDNVQHELERVKLQCQQQIAERDAKARVMERLLRSKIDDANLELQSRIRELERVNEVMVDRELRMVELQKQVDALRKEVDMLHASNAA